MAVITLKVTSDADDGWVSREGEPAWPPAANTNANTGSAEAPLAEKHYYEAISGNPYYLGVGIVRWDTSIIPDGATINSAIYRAHITNIFDAESRSFCMEWGDGSTIDVTDYSDTVVQNAFAPVTLASLVASIGADKDFTLLNPNTFINKTGYTSLRQHITGMTAPAFAAFPASTLNGAVFASFGLDNGTTILASRLIIDFDMDMVDLRPDADVTATGWNTAPLWSKVEESSADGTVITGTPV